MVGDFGWEHEGTECQVDTVKRSKPFSNVVKSLRA